MAFIPNTHAYGPADTNDDADPNATTLDDGTTLATFDSCAPWWLTVDVMNVQTWTLFSLVVKNFHLAAWPHFKEDGTISKRLGVLDPFRCAFDILRPFQIWRQSSCEAMRHSWSSISIVSWRRMMNVSFWCKRCLEIPSEFFWSWALCEWVSWCVWTRFDVFKRASECDLEFFSNEWAFFVKLTRMCFRANGWIMFY